ncbi:MAG: cyclic nucleotide-binding protein [Crocinitomicaceae bacterium]|nr:cyclic nucleotide-binding protein [Crocinitomicaceae bacterium]|tara:strand:+ start:6413 stop:7024 length:612 start_codon:yes stop_codon:yes gene_type:complete
METRKKLELHLQGLQVLTQDEINIILDATVLKECKKGDFLLLEGQTQTQCYTILEGCIREYSLAEGEEKTTAFYTEGDKITSYTAAGKKTASKHYLECSEDVVLTVSTQNFEDDLRKLVPRLDAIIQQIAMEQLSKGKDEWTNFVSSSPEERYTKLMETRPYLFNRVPQHQIASYLGIKPESLSRIRKRIHTKHQSNSDSANS